MRPRRGEPSARTKILAASRELFSQRGYDETPVLTIARTAGVSRATVYKNFVDKREILSAIVAEYMAGYGAMVTRLSEERRPEQTSFELIESMIRGALSWRVANADIRPLIMVARSLPDSGWDEADQGVDEAIIAWITSIHQVDLEAGIVRPDIDLDFGIRAAYSMLESVLSTFDVNSSKRRINEAAHQLALLHWHAICSVEPEDAGLPPLELAAAMVTNGTPPV